ncbi:MAG: hypothetical protein ORN28_06705 [Rhodoferax sp.]|nr:hypothetical protein [Rhodoferax sp.]
MEVAFGNAATVFLLFGTSAWVMVNTFNISRYDAPEPCTCGAARIHNQQCFSAVAPKVLGKILIEGVLLSHPDFLLLLVETLTKVPLDKALDHPINDG